MSLSGMKSRSIPVSSQIMSSTSRIRASVRARPALRVAPGAAEQMVLRRAVRLVAGKDT